jgi:2-dehydro-3-deoxyglucarate aldolase/4-hydroxy-2-oxoheptanedioate aldolase
MKANRFRQVLEAGGIPVGHMVMEFGTRGICQLLESADVDFALFDMEHSGFDIDRICDLIAWSKAGTFAPFVRVPQGLYHFLARVMDAGALGVMVANVETPEHAREIVQAVKYAPVGRRGVCLGTAHTDYVMPDAADYFKECNDSSVVICQIESELGVTNARAIAATPGVDVLWVGHYDLTQSLGIPAQFHHEKFLRAMHTVVAAGREHGKALGLQPGTPEQADEWIRMGFNAISWSSDVGLYRSSLQAGVNHLREKTAKAKPA